MLSRRDLLVGFGGIAFSGSILATAGRSSPEASVSWKPRKLDGRECAKIAYHSYWEENGGCGYAVFKGIIGMMGTKYGTPYDTFPLSMMSYASGGIAGWGTVCGALNCAAACFALFYARNDFVPMIDTLFSWYESAELPVFVPEDPVIPIDIESLVTKSVLCHASLSRWSYATGLSVNSNECRERCSRVAADVARKTIEVMNAKIENTLPLVQLSTAQQKCAKCHSKGRDADCSRTKMDCSFCHNGLLKDKFTDNSH
jgi:hypothetical protein